MAGIRVPRSQATAFGVIDAAADNKIKAFLEKPADPPGLPDDPEASFASMGNYIFTADALIDALQTDAENEDSRHDMGGDIIPSFVDPRARPRSTTSPPTRCPDQPTGTRRTGATWGRIDAYHEAHMDLVSVDPVFNLYNNDWPIWTYPVQMPGAKFTLGGPAIDSIVSPGCIVSGGVIDDSVLSPNVRVQESARIDQSVIFTNARIGAARGSSGPSWTRTWWWRTAPRSGSTTRPIWPAATPSPTAASPSSARASRRRDAASNRC